MPTEALLGAAVGVILASFGATLFALLGVLVGSKLPFEKWKI